MPLSRPAAVADGSALPMTLSSVSVVGSARRLRSVEVEWLQ